MIYVAVYNQIDPCNKMWESQFSTSFIQNNTHRCLILSIVQFQYTQKSMMKEVYNFKLLVENCQTYYDFPLVNIIFFMFSFYWNFHIFTRITQLWRQISNNYVNITIGCFLNNLSQRKPFLHKLVWNILGLTILWSNISKA